MKRVAVVAVSFCLAACGTERTRPTSSEFESEVRLGALLPPGAQLVGVAASPEGKTYVLDRRSGLYELGPSTAKLVFATADLETRYGWNANLELTDVTALGDERFALPAVDDGFLLDLHGGTFTRYFCYLPSAGPAPALPEIVSASTEYRKAGIEVKQRTESVAFSPQSQRLFAQPQTIRLDTNEVVGSELFVFPDWGGQPMQVMPTGDLSFLAGGMVAVDDQRLLLGVHDRLYETTPTGAPALLHTFQAPIEITGMARAANGNLLLLDAAGQRLVEVSGY